MRKKYREAATFVQKAVGNRSVTVRISGAEKVADSMKLAKAIAQAVETHDKLHTKSQN